MKLKPLLVASADSGQRRRITEAGLVVVHPLERKRRSVRCLESKKKELIEFRRGGGKQAALRFGSLLLRVEEALLAGGGERPVSFVPTVLSA